MAYRKLSSHLLAATRNGRGPIAQKVSLLCHFISLSAKLSRKIPWRRLEAGQRQALRNVLPILDRLAALIKSIG